MGRLSVSQVETCTVKGNGGKALTVCVQGVRNHLL